MERKKKRYAPDAPAAKAQKRQHREGSPSNVVELDPEQALIFTGAATLEVVRGSVDVGGFIATPTTTPITLTADVKTCGALCIRPAQGCAPATAAVAAAGPAAGASVRVVQLAVPSAGRAPVPAEVVKAHRLWLQGADGAPQPWTTPPEWLQAVQLLAEASAAAARTPGAAPLMVAVCGSKGAGKSSLGRLLANRLLSQHGTVAYLDTDCGQPEMTPPGLVSLHFLDAPLLGAPHHHQRVPELAFFQPVGARVDAPQGDTSPQTDPQRYLRSITALHHAYSAHASDEGGRPPLVINTHGWVSGMGLDLLTELLGGMGATHVVTLQTPAAKKNLPPGHFWLEQGEPPLCQLVTLPALAAAAAAAPAGGSTASGPASGAQRPAGSATELMSQQSSLASGGDWAGTGREQSTASTRSVGAVESRSLQWLAWARRAAALPAPGLSSDADAFADVAAALAAASPYEVGLGAVEVQLLFGDVAPEQLLVVLNASVVGLAAAQLHGSAAGAGDALRPCLGVGLVRAVDGAARRLYLLTDVPAADLESVEVLQVGRLELPLALLQTQQLASPYQALFCLASGATGAGPIKSRNNLLRVGLMGKG